LASWRLGGLISSTPLVYNHPMPTRQINGAEIHFSENGAGVPLVLVHGFPLDQRVWRNQLGDLANTCRVIAPDLRGFGKSPPSGPFTIESLADDLHELLHELSALPCILGGLSMGGYVSLAFAKKYLPELRGLILTDTRAAADTPQGREGRNAMIELARTRGSAAVAEQMLPKSIADPAFAPLARQIMEACPAQTVQFALAAMRDRSDYTDFLPMISTPTLIIVGESDAITTPSMAETMRDAIPGATLAIIPGAGHLSPLERPAEVSAAIRRFVMG